MRLRMVGAACSVLLMLLCVTAHAAPARSAKKPAAPPTVGRDYIGTTADVGQFLPDNAILGRVGAKDIRVFDFRDGYFASSPEVRPATDSLGRLQFLRNMVKKEILGQTALAAGYNLTFEERALLREHRATILSNLLYMRTVRDSSKISEDSLRTVFRFYGEQLKIQLLFFTQREQAELVRLQLLRGTLSWTSAFARYAADLGNGRGGELDSLRFAGLPIELSLQIWPVQPGKVSPLIVSTNGYYLVRVADRRPTPTPDYHVMRSVIRLTLLDVEASARRRMIQTEAKRTMAVVYDSTNIRWAMSRFGNAVSSQTQHLTTTITVEESLPEFDSPDLKRVLVRWKNGEVTLGDVFQRYSELPPISRPSLNTVDRLMDYADALMLEPRMLEIAEERGLDKDSTAIALIGRKHEEMLVTRMVEDSVFSRISVTEADRQQYYRDHLKDFLTFSLARFAIVVRPTRAGADSVKQLLDSGTRAQAIVAADSLRGEVRSGIAETRRDVGVEFRKLLFEEMRPGQAQVFGPDRTKSFAVIQLLEIVPERQLSYQEAAPYIEESVLNTMQEQALEALIARLASRFEVKLYPERLMFVKLTDPTVDGL